MAFPNTKTAFTDLTLVGGVYRPVLDDFNVLRQAINRIEDNIGLGAQGAVASIDARLDAMDATIAAGGGGGAVTRTPFEAVLDTQGDLTTATSGGPGASWKQLLATPGVPLGGLIDIHLAVQVYLDAGKLLGLGLSTDNAGSTMVDGLAPAWYEGAGVVGLNRVRFNIQIKNVANANPQIYYLWVCGRDQTTPTTKVAVVVKRGKTGGVLPVVFNGVVYS